MKVSKMHKDYDFTILPEHNETIYSKSIQLTVGDLLDKFNNPSNAIRTIAPARHQRSLDILTSLPQNKHVATLHYRFFFRSVNYERVYVHKIKPVGPKDVFAALIWKRYNTQETTPLIEARLIFCVDLKELHFRDSMLYGDSALNIIDMSTEEATTVYNWNKTTINFSTNYENSLMIKGTESASSDYVVYKLYENI